MRYKGPKAKLNRRFKKAIFPRTKAEERKPYFPGQHGPRLRRSVSDYAAGLLEKQKLRYTYSLTDKQLRLLYDKARGIKGVTGDIILQHLDTRLDSVVYYLGLGKTRRAARQMVAYGHVMVNGQKVDIPSFICQAGDVIEVKNRTSSKRLGTQSLESTQYRAVPAWLTMEHDKLRGVVNRWPSAEELDRSFNTQLVVEFYGR